MPINQNINLKISPNITPRSNPLGSVARPTPKPKGALEKIDIDKIGKGYLMTEGSYGRSFGIGKGAGLKGQLSTVRKAGIKTTTKNLSKKNIEQMHDLLAEAISKNAVSSNTYISRRDRASIMKKSRELAKTPDSGFSFEDRQDLLTIVDEMRQQHREKLLKNNFDDLNQPDPKQTDKSGLDNPKPNKLQTNNNFNLFAKK
ncbi:MAG: hypothetical protein PHP37_01005 [Patescibacteria group bacterium]|nr:hypothetical protein [Patescibacteria group bacterium]